MNYSTTYQSPVGELTLASDGESITGLWIQGQKYHGGGISGKVTKKNDLPVFEAAKKWLDKYFAGKRPSITDLPLRPAGSAFRKAVWAVLCEIPYGSVVTYGGIAKKIAAEMDITSMSSQAVGGAVGHNPISVIIPCHRVVGSGGSLTGYAGGIGTKVKLLELEGVDLSGLFVPKKGTAL